MSAAHTPKKNKTLEMVTAIDQGIHKDCGTLSLTDDADRAKLAWWIHNNFCIGDWRENLHVRDIDLMAQQKPRHARMVPLRTDPPGTGIFPGPENLSTNNSKKE